MSRANLRLTALCLLFLSPAIWWIAIDRSAWAWDQSWFAEVSIDLWWTLTHQPRLWPGAMISAFGQKAPLIAWIGQLFVPFGQLTGSMEVALLVSVLLTQLGALLLIGASCRRLWPQSMLPASVAVAFAAAAPLFAGMSHQYFAEPLQTLAAAWAFYIAVHCRGWSRIEISWQVLACVATGLLAKSSTPLYFAFPLAYAAIAWFRPAHAPVARWRIALLPASFVLLMAAGAWYIRNLDSVIRHARFSASSADYGWTGAYLDKLVFWLKAIAHSIFFPGMMPVFGILAAACFAAIVVRKKMFPSPPVVWLAVAHACAVLLVFSSATNTETRYLEALIPGLALCAAWLVSASGVQWMAWIWFAAASLQWVLVYAAAIAGTPGQACAWLIPARPAAGIQEDLRKSVSIATQHSGGGRFHIIGIEQPGINANTASFYSAELRLQSGMRTFFTSFGYAENSIDRALARIEELNAACVISLEETRQPDPPNFLNIVSKGALARLRNDPRFRPVPFENGTGIVIYCRAP